MGVFSCILLIIFTVIFILLCTPTMAFGFGGLWFVGLLWSLAFLVASYCVQKQQKDKLIITKIISIIMLLYFFVVPILTSVEFLHSEAYHNLLGNVEEINFDEHIAQIDNSQIRVVDKNTAHKLADQKIGTMGAAASEVKLGTVELQKVRGQLYWVAPLEYRGLIQWLNGTYSKTGTPGYIMVSATNQNDIQLINKIEDKDIFIKYQPNAYGMQDIERHVYLNGFMTKGLTDFTFEIDDNLVPYWVVTVYDRKIGFKGEDAIGVVVVNAQTGDIKYYDIKDTPEWIDRIQPEKFIRNQISYWGEYVFGYLNSTMFGSKSGTLQPASLELHLTYGADGQCYWYTGITSTSKDESTTGFMLVNSRTKETKYIKLAGKQEPAAKRSADAVGKPFFVTSGDIVLYNIGGKPTYITPMKNSEGLTAGVAAILVEDYNIVGFGKDIDSAITNYHQVLASKGNILSPSVMAKTLEIESRVERISNLVRDGQTYYYITLDGYTQIFVGSVTTSDKLPLTKPNDLIFVKYEETKERKVNIINFDNRNINNTPPTTQQIIKEQNYKQK